jgi:hypothetical protein
VNRRPAPAEAGIPFKPRDTLKTAEEQVRWSTMLLFDEGRAVAPVANGVPVAVTAGAAAASLRSRSGPGLAVRTWRGAYRRSSARATALG